MVITSLCLMLSATLNITPKFSQFFRYDRITLKCATPGNSTGWSVWRNTSLKTAQVCSHGWAIPGESSCIIETAYPSDTGVYWCKSKRGECSNTVNITVTAGGVILQSPALPVTEGDNVTLNCFFREGEEFKSTSDFTAVFYKDDVFIGNAAKGEMILNSVSKSKEGHYRCEHPGGGKSEHSWLAVRDRDQLPIVPPTPPPPVLTLPNMISTILLFILYTFILIICIHMYRKWAKVRANKKRNVSNHVVLE